MFRILEVGSSGPVQLSEDESRVARPDEGQIRWIDLSQQDVPQLSLLAQRFGFHPLTIEDCLHFNQRSKLEAYEGYLFLVIHGFELEIESCEGAPLELHLFVGRDFLVTVHQEAIPSMEAVWNRMHHDEKLLRRGPDFACYLLADAIADAYFPMLDEVTVKVDDIEDRILDDHDDVGLEELLKLKRLLVQLRKFISPQRDVLALLAKRGEGWVSEQTAIYFRDVYDHMLRVHENVESARDLLGSALDAYLWSASQRTNEIMKRLTLLSAVFLPLTFITGFFGQNFSHLPFSDDRLMGLMLASCVIIPTGMLLYFLRSKWF